LLYGFGLEILFNQRIEWFFCLTPSDNKKLSKAIKPFLSIGFFAFTDEMNGIFYRPMIQKD